MKYIALLGALVVICLVLTRQSSPVAGVQQAVAEADAIAPPATASAPASTTTSALKQPIDRTKAVLEQVKARNGNGEF